jgi:hypothetical protein
MGEVTIPVVITESYSARLRFSAIAGPLPCDANRYVEPQAIFLRAYAKTRDEVLEKIQRELQEYMHLYELSRIETTTLVYKP